MRPSILLFIAPIIGFTAPHEFSPSTRLEVGLESFQREHPKQDIFGYELHLNRHPSKLDVFYSPEPALLTYARFVCADQSLRDRSIETHCVPAKSEHKPISFQNKTASFSLDEYLEVTRYALDMFGKSIASAETITSIKAWESLHRQESFIQLVVKWLDQDAGIQTSYFFCHHHAHKHGDGHEHTELDCHRSRGAGPNEPIFGEPI